MIDYSVDRATSQLTNDANRMSQSLLQRLQIVLKDSYKFINRTSASNLGHACIFYLGDDQNRSTLLQVQVHALAANSGPPFRSCLATPTSGTPPNHFR